MFLGAVNASTEHNSCISRLQYTIVIKGNIVGLLCAYNASHEALPIALPPMVCTAPGVCWCTYVVHFWVYRGSGKSVAMGVLWWVLFMLC